MKDEYAGQAGTFVVDTELGVRLPLAEYMAQQANANAKADKKPPKSKQDNQDAGE